MNASISWAKLQSEAIATVTLRPDSPLLIMASQPEKRRTEGGKERDVHVHVSAIRTGEKVYYIPGSSLKGVFRAHTEKIFSHLFGLQESRALIDQLFGHLKFRGRFSVDDAFFTMESVVVENRKNVAIDRFRGGAKKGALYEMDVIAAGECTVKIYIKNPQEWELFWLCVLLRDLNLGRITLGAKKSFGFGKMGVSVQSLDICMYDKDLESKWKEWLGKEHEVELYNTYQFTKLDHVAGVLEKYWKELIEEKEGAR